MKNKTTIKMIFRYLKKYSHLVILSIVLSICYVVASLLIPYYIGNAIDYIVGPNNVNFEMIYKYFMLIIINVTIIFITLWLLGIINNLLTYNITFDIRYDAFMKINNLPLKYLDKHSSGEITSKIINDVDTFSIGLLLGFSELFTGIITIIITLVLMLKINWIISLMVVVLTPISIFVSKIVASRINKYFIIQSEQKALQTSYVDEQISNIKVVKAFNHEQDSTKEFELINEELSKTSLKAVFFSSIVNPTTRFLNSIIYAVVCLVGALIIISNNQAYLTIGSLAILLSYSKEYSKPFNDISSVITELQNAFACCKRVFDLIDNNMTEVEDNEGLIIQEPNNKFLCNNILLSQDNSLSYDITFNNVSFYYDVNKPLIENLSLEIKKGQKVAIVGPTGSGKTTFINLIMRFYDPVSGEIYIDGNKSTSLNRESLRKLFGMVLQDTWIKSGTIKENICLGKKNATMEEVIEACKKAKSHDFIIKLKDGYNTVLNEYGSNLSIGEKQLLSISRIMLLMPPMLILDEATSSIDTRTESSIQKAFMLLMKDKTSFIVAHRLQTIKEADIIIVMKDGKVIEKGNHKELLAQKGFYFELYSSQLSE